MKKIPVILTKKKLIACILSVMMVCGMSVFSFAEGDAALAEETAVKTEGVVDDDALLAEDETETEEKTAAADQKEEKTAEQKEEKIADQKEEKTAEKLENEGQAATTEKEKEKEGVVTAQAIPKDLKVQFSGVKTLDGRALKDNEFCFVLSDLTNTSAEDIVSWNDKNGNYSLILPIDEALSDHRYRISEKTASDSKYNFTSDSSVTYDTNVYNIAVTVTDYGIVTVYSIDKDGNRTRLDSTEDSQYNYKGFNFKNTVKSSGNQVTPAALSSATYQFKAKVTLPSSKKLTKDQFSFTLKETTEGVADADKTKLTAKNDSTGIITFAPIKFTKEGKYNYTISQDDSSDSTITADKDLIKAEITVSENEDGTALVPKLTKLTKGSKNTDILSTGMIFANKAKDSSSSTTNNKTTNNTTTNNTTKGVQTGDSSDIGLFSALLVGFVVILIGTLFSFRRRKTNRK